MPFIYEVEIQEMILFPLGKKPTSEYITFIKLSFDSSFPLIFRFNFFPLLMPFHFIRFQGVQINAISHY